MIGREQDCALAPSAAPSVVLLEATPLLCFPLSLPGPATKGVQLRGAKAGEELSRFWRGGPTVGQQTRFYRLLSLALTKLPRPREGSIMLSWRAGRLCDQRRVSLSPEEVSFNHGKSERVPRASSLAGGCVRFAGEMYMAPCYPRCGAVPRKRRPRR